VSWPVEKLHAQSEAVKYTDLIPHKALKTTYTEVQHTREGSKTMRVAEDNALCHTAKLRKVACEE